MSARGANEQQQQAHAGGGDAHAAARPRAHSRCAETRATAASAHLEQRDVDSSRRGGGDAALDVEEQRVRRGGHSTLLRQLGGRFVRNGREGARVGVRRLYARIVEVVRDPRPCVDAVDALGEEEGHDLNRLRLVAQQLGREERAIEFGADADLELHFALRGALRPELRSKARDDRNIK